MRDKGFSPFPMATLTQSGILRRRICLRGIVQGVGFRPFVYNLAKNIGIRGFILNSSSGVTIEAEGTEAASRRIHSILGSSSTAGSDRRSDNVWSWTRWAMRFSRSKQSLAIEGEFALVSPDVATCDDCLRDIDDPANRRFGYPFTNCTNCGPRYTIIQDIPYDRPTTTMSGFRMCADCEAEYHDPANRRFHAQPNACPDVRPQRGACEERSDFSEGRGIRRQEFERSISRGATPSARWRDYRGKRTRRISACLRRRK